MSFHVHDQDRIAKRNPDSQKLTRSNCMSSARPALHMHRRHSASSAVHACLPEHLTVYMEVHEDKFHAPSACMLTSPHICMRVYTHISCRIAVTCVQTLTRVSSRTCTASSGRQSAAAISVRSKAAAYLKRKVRSGSVPGLKTAPQPERANPSESSGLEASAEESHMSLSSHGHLSNAASWPSSRVCQELRPVPCKWQQLQRLHKDQ